LQRRPVVGVEAGGPTSVPTAAQEQALMTQDVLDRLLATCSPDRLADICDRAVASAPINPTSPTLCCLAIQRGHPWPVSQARRRRVLRATVRRSIDPRKAVLEKRALAPLSINLIAKGRCALIGLDATEFAANGLRSAYAAARPRSILLPWTMQQRQQRSVVQQVPGYIRWCSRCRATKVKLSRTREDPPTHAIGEARLIRAVLSADNSKAMHKKANARRWARRRTLIIH
jgi:hypothetical protein